MKSMNVIHVILQVFQNGCLMGRTRSDNEFVSDIYKFIDNPQYESPQTDKKTLFEDAKFVYKDLDKALSGYKSFMQ